MVELISIIIGVIAVIIIAKLIDWLLQNQKRYIPKYIKEAVLKRYFNMCAVCPESNELIMEYHHRKKFADGGDNSEKNIVPLCPYHHSLITRYPPNNQPQ